MISFPATYPPTGWVEVLVACHEKPVLKFNVHCPPNPSFALSPRIGSCLSLAFIVALVRKLFETLRQKKLKRRQEESISRGCNFIRLDS